MDESCKILGNMTKTANVSQSPQSATRYHQAQSEKKFALLAISNQIVMYLSLSVKIEN
jgi:hypothetical protein